MFGYSFIQLAGLLCLAVLPAVFAVPKVTPVPLSGNCSDYSSVEYRRDRNKSGAFVLKLVTETNSTATNIYSSARTSYRYDFVLFFGFVRKNITVMSDSSLTDHWNRLISHPHHIQTVHTLDVPTTHCRLMCQPIFPKKVGKT